VAGFLAGSFELPLTLGIHARMTGSVGRWGTEYPAALTEGGKRSSGLSCFLGLTVCTDPRSVDGVVRKVRKVSLDAGVGDGSGVRAALVGTCEESQGREYIAQEQSGLRLQMVVVARTMDPELPQYVRDGSVASSVGAVSWVVRSLVAASEGGKPTPFHHSR